MMSPGLSPAGIQPGWLDTVLFTDPPSGQSFTRKVPGEFAERVIAVTGHLVTSAVTGNRQVVFQLLDRNGLTVVSAALTNNVVAGSTIDAFGVGNYAGSSKGASGTSLFPIPDLIVVPGMSWALAVTGIDPGITAPTGLAAAAVVGGGTFAAGTYFWKVTGTDAQGETTGSNEASATIALNGSANLTWNALPAGTTGVKLYRGTAAGAEDHMIATLGAVTSTTDTGTAGSAATPPAASSATGDALTAVNAYLWRFPASQLVPQPGG